MINYALLTKPGIIFGNLITLAAGFWLGSKGEIDFPLFFAALLGLTGVIASACVLNNYIDKDRDAKMERTKNRALVKGVISDNQAFLFAAFLGILGTAILFTYTNKIATLLALLGFSIYILLYSLWKSRTIYGTAIGSLAGAIPPLVGYAAANGRLDLSAYLLFIILVLWQMPHFFAIALYRLKEYKNADIPVLPVKKSIWQTKVHMTLYIIAFIAACLLLSILHGIGTFYLITLSILGFLWLGLCLKGFWCKDDQAWGKDMFRLSLGVIMGLCVAIILNH